MLKKTILFLAVAIFTLSCSNETKTTSKSDEGEEGIVSLNVNEFEEKAGDYVDKEVYMTGTVVHVCKHGGQKVHISGDDPDVRVKVNAGDKIGGFDRELEGSDIKVKGVVSELKVDDEYLDDWEAEVREHHEENDEDGKAELERIAEMRKEAEESEKGYLSFYSLEGISYEVVKEGTPPKNTEGENEDEEEKKDENTEKTDEH